MKEEWFDLIADFGKTLHEFTSLEKARDFINSLKIFLSISENPSNILDVLSYSLKDPSFKCILIDGNINLIEKLNAQSDNPELLKIKDSLVSEKFKIQKTIDENEMMMMFLLFPYIFSESNNRFEKNSGFENTDGPGNTERSENADWHEEYREYLDSVNANWHEDYDEYQ